MLFFENRMAQIKTITANFHNMHFKICIFLVCFQFLNFQTDVLIEPWTAFAGQLIIILPVVRGMSQPSGYSYSLLPLFWQNMHRNRGRLTKKTNSAYFINSTYFEERWSLLDARHCFLVYLSREPFARLSHNNPPRIFADRTSCS